MTQLCPRCLQPLPEESKNDIDSDLPALLESIGRGEVLGLWGRISYVTTDDLDKRKHVSLHAAHMDAFIHLLQLAQSFKNIAVYDSLGTGDEDSEL